MSDFFFRSALVFLLATLVVPLLPEPVWASLFGLTFGVAVMWAGVEVTGE